MVVKKNDFVELEFLAKVKDTNEVFDTNIKAEAEKAKLDIKDIKPLIVSVGNKMLIPGLDRVLEGKEEGKKHTEEFKPEEAFGKRNSALTRMIPLKMFIEQKIMPERGMQLSLDGSIAKILSVSGGRVLVDFNHPLAGKSVVYDFKVNKKIDNMAEKVDALQDFFFRKKFEFNLSEKDKKLTFKVPKGFENFLKLISEPFKTILGFDVLFEELKEKQEKPKEEMKKTENKKEQPKQE